MSLKNISIVLVKPQIGENIGATARVMKNFGLNSLSIVSPKEQWPNRKAIYTSVKASDIIHKTKVFNSTKDALAKSDIVFATTARVRNINKKILPLSDAIKIINTSKKKISILFGPENAGLSNEDLISSNYLLKIPTDKKYESLNLSHAVSVVAYCLYSSRLKRIKYENTDKSEIASQKDLYKFYDFLIGNLENTGFFRPIEKKPFMVKSIKNIFAKQLLTLRELRTLMGIFSSFRKY
jgi:tRNA/rRNA methyltransferase